MAQGGGGRVQPQHLRHRTRCAHRQTCWGMPDPKYLGCNGVSPPPLLPV